ncbi:hypothetical protein D3C76_1533810 [compost metagenome]
MTPVPHDVISSKSNWPGGSSWKPRPKNDCTLYRRRDRNGAFASGLLKFEMEIPATLRISRACGPRLASDRKKSPSIFSSSSPFLTGIW